MNGTVRRPLTLLAAVVVLLGACEPSATAVTVEGRADVVDGDSFEIGAVEIRLFGVDAPEGRQTCRRNGAAWRCGEDAAAHLRALVSAGAITCSQRDVDSYGRMVAVCTRGAVDLGREMVRSGMALAYRQYSSDYVADEEDARNARRGIWSSEFEAPWSWRRSAQDQAQDGAARTTSERGSRADAGVDARRADVAGGQTSPTPECRIKGNINRDGERIYHVPGSRSYDDTVVDPNRGERWFCTPAAAQQAGWRAPRG